MHWGFKYKDADDNMEKGNYISISDSGAKLSVSVIVFKENDVYIAYCPSLDLSGYDHTEEAAKRDFEYVLHQWLTEQMESNTLHDDLRQHGWKMSGTQCPSHTDPRPQI